MWLLSRVLLAAPLPFFPLSWKGVESAESEAISGTPQCHEMAMFTSYQGLVLAADLGSIVIMLAALQLIAFVVGAALCYLVCIRIQACLDFALAWLRPKPSLLLPFAPWYNHPECIKLWSVVTDIVW